VIPEVWRIQDRLAEDYPEVTEETSPQPDGRLVRAYVFSNPSSRRLIKASQENFVVVFNSYSTFEEFKAEAVTRTAEFSHQFEVTTYHRVGLRYVNHIELPALDGIRILRRYVNLPIDFGHLDEPTIEQLLTEFRLKVRSYRLTVRGALIPFPTKPQELLYILDLDCHGTGQLQVASLPTLLDEFHHEIQVRFLEHVTEEYKGIMRRRT